jgi:hypothetical protein
MTARSKYSATVDLLGEEALIVEAREPARRRRHFLIQVVVVLIPITLTACTIHNPQGASISPSTSSSPTKALTCPSARVKLLGVSAIFGGLGHGGVVVRASVTSPSTCTMSGYPIIGVELTSHPTATAGHVRQAYLGGFENASAPLPQILITSRPIVVSFTIQWATGNGPTCPQIKAFQITLPGSRGVLTARSVYEAPIGLIQGRGLGIYCGNLQVTPLVKGSSGNGS